jgi:hypothetical protein
MGWAYAPEWACAPVLYQLQDLARLGLLLDGEQC